MTPAEVREARLAVGQTQKQFGEMLHATERTVQMWEAGHRNMTAATEELLKIKLRERKMEFPYTVECGNGFRTCRTYSEAVQCFENAPTAEAHTRRLVDESTQEVLMERWCEPWEEED